MTTQELLQTFVEDFGQAGFGVIRQALPPVEAAECHALLDGLIDPRPRGEATPLQRVVPRLVERDERFARLATSPPLVATLNAIFGLVPQLVCSYGHEKAPHTQAHTGPHSDVAHLPGVPHHQSLLMVKVVYALTAVRVGSGGTVIFPGSHREPPNGHGAPAAADGHYVTLDSGDLLMFHANARHTATDNASPDRRLGAWFVYALPWMRVFPGYEYSDTFLQAVRASVASQPHLAWVYGLRDPYAT